MFIDISEMDPADVLRRLFDAAKAAPALVPRMEDLAYGVTRLMTLDEAQRVLAHSKDIDYLAGRPLKLDFRSNPLDVSLYDRDHGASAAARALGIELGDGRLSF